MCLNNEDVRACCRRMNTHFYPDTEGMMMRRTPRRRLQIQMDVCDALGLIWDRNSVTVYTLFGGRMGSCFEVSSSHPGMILLVD